MGHPALTPADTIVVWHKNTPSESCYDSQFDSLFIPCVSSKEKFAFGYILTDHGEFINRYTVPIEWSGNLHATREEGEGKFFPNGGAPFVIPYSEIA